MQKISVIVPVYKAEPFLDRCVSSLVNQTYKNIEIILVDDESPDNCPAMCDEWAKKDSRIKVIHKKNNGVSEARASGVNASDSAYVAFVDSDDWVRCDMLEHLYSLIQSGEYDISSCGYSLVTDSSEPDDTSGDDNHILDFDGRIKHLYDYNLWSMCCKLYKRELFDKSMPQIELTVSEDLLLNYFIFKKCGNIIVSDKQKYFYFRHTDSVMAGSVSDTRVKDSLSAYRIIADDMDKNSTAYCYHSANRIKNDFRLINEIIKQNQGEELYKLVRDDFLSQKKYVFAKENSDSFTVFNKILTVLLADFPFIYKFLIKAFR